MIDLVRGGGGEGGGTQILNATVRPDSSLVHPLPCTTHKENCVVNSSVIGKPLRDRWRLEKV